MAFERGRRTIFDCRTSTNLASAKLVRRSRRAGPRLAPAIRHAGVPPSRRLPTSARPAGHVRCRLSDNDPVAKSRRRVIAWSIALAGEPHAERCGSNSLLNVFESGAGRAVQPRRDARGFRKRYNASVRYRPVTRVGVYSCKKLGLHMDIAPITMLGRVAAPRET